MASVALHYTLMEPPYRRAHNTLHSLYHEGREYLGRATLYCHPSSLKAR